MDIVCPGLRDRRSAAIDESNFRRVSRALNDAGRPDIRAIILHSTMGPQFINGDGPELPPPSEDSRRRSRHRIDRIAAHFIVINDGTLFYTRDVRYISHSAGRRLGIDIEFAYDHQDGETLSQEALVAGRRLVQRLVHQIDTIDYIHPHGQVQRRLMDGRECGGRSGVSCGKLRSCPGTEVWRGVGVWASRTHGLHTDPPLPFYQNNGIHQ